MRKLWVIGIAVLALVGVTFVLAQDGDEPESEYAGTFPAPEFPTGLDWLNVPAPLTLADLEGKIVLLDFWTYGCINCIHMIPVLERLEQKYSDALVVVGVHSAKFANEGETDNIRQIVQRYDLHHPVINDQDFVVWQTYAPFGVQAWPTFVLIDPLGNILAVQPGEVPYEAFERVIDGMVQYFDGLSLIDREPLELRLEEDAAPTTALSFPGKVIADTEANRLFIADTNHNRIVIADLNTYEVLDVVGTGARGFDNGRYDAATFNKPQGMTLYNNTLYVADTNNHAIRAVDLSDRTVITIAGTGEQSRVRNAAGFAPDTALASPWDVEMNADGTNLYIAMAGPHQLWAISMADQTVGPIVGSGREGLVDGTFADAQLAQPSGLYYDAGTLYFADSESSSIRYADINGREVHTLAGPRTNDLFDFGDVDGEVGVSRLQHALGVTGDENGLLYVADTYNSKIKLLDPETQAISTVFGLGGLGGFRDGSAAEAEFDEPGGLDYANGKLYVADTNNNNIRVIDLATNTVSTIVFPNPEALQIEGRATVVAGNSALGVEITLPEQTVQAGDSEIVLNITLPEGYKLNDLAPFTSVWTHTGESITISDENQRQQIVEPELPIRVPVELADGEDVLHGAITIYYCEAVQESLCFIDQVKIDAPLTITADAAARTITLDHTVVPPQLPTTNGL